MLIAIAFMIVTLVGLAAFIAVQIAAAIENHRACKGVTIYRIRKDGTLEKIK